MFRKKLYGQAFKINPKAHLNRWNLIRNVDAYLKIVPEIETKEKAINKKNNQ